MVDSAMVDSAASLALFRAIPYEQLRNRSPRDTRDLMAYPFFALGKSRRTQAIIFQAGNVRVRVDGCTEHGLATIWDADILIWACSQLVAAHRQGCPTSRRMQVTPYELLGFIGRGTSRRDYERLHAALDRLQSTSVMIALHRHGKQCVHRFSWLNEWRGCCDSRGRSTGLELILPDWFYRRAQHAALVLSIDPAYFQLSGGIERWLYRLVRKHGGHQVGGWQFDFHYLYRKSGSSARYSDFALAIRRIVRRQSLPGYVLSVQWPLAKVELLCFWPRSATSKACASGATVPGDKL